MPTLDEIRMWAKGVEVEGLPEKDEERHRNVRSNPFEPIKYVCESCQAMPPNKYTCNDCEGLGYVLSPTGKMCSKCQGSGVWSDEKCTSCDGIGWVRIRKKIPKKKYKTKGEFRLSSSGADAMLLFGQHIGKKVSEVESGYLRWIIRDEFDEQLKDVCRHTLKKRQKKK